MSDAKPYTDEEMRRIIAGQRGVFLEGAVFNPHDIDRWLATVDALRAEAGASGWRAAVEACARECDEQATYLDYADEPGRATSVRVASSHIRTLADTEGGDRE